MKFSETLKDLMIENGIDIKALSSKTGVKISTIYFYFEYNTLPDINSALRLSEYFNCSIDYLLGLTEHNTLNVKTKDINFINNYEFLIKQFGTTNYKVCNDLHIDRNSIYNWRKGHIPKMVTLIELAKYFNTSIEFLLGRMDEY